MSKRLDKPTAQFRNATSTFAGAMATSPASSLVALHATEADAYPFIDIASRLITATAIQNGLSCIYAIHVDHWFGPRWLGFCGKIAGSAGVRNLTLKRALNVPPFHPNRVIKARGHHLRQDGLYADAEDLKSLHAPRRSETNLFRTIRSNILYAWYSGNTQVNKKGVVMIYYATEAKTKAFYVMFNGDSDWRIEEHIGITRAEVGDLLSRFSGPNTL